MNKKVVSKHATVARPPFELYMGFVDMRNFVNFLPEDKKEGITADYDSISGTFQGFNLGIRVVSRVPYSRIDFESTDSPIPFSFSLHFDSNGSTDSTDFYVELNAELNMMMNMMIGGKLQKGVDQIVEALANAAVGKFPEGFDPSQYGYPKQ